MPDTTPTPQEQADEAKRLADEYTAKALTDLTFYAPAAKAAARVNLHAAIDRMREALEKAQAGAGEAVLWEYELATAVGPDGAYTGWRWFHTTSKPCVTEGAVRNLRPLVYGDARPVAAQAAEVPAGWAPGQPITEAMHVAACKVLARANGLDGTPQRMLDAMLAAAPPSPVARVPMPFNEQKKACLAGCPSVIGIPYDKGFLDGIKAAEKYHGIGPQDG